jgi:hypothetical protein
MYVLFLLIVINAPDVMYPQKAVSDRTSYDVVWLKYLAQEMMDEGLCQFS